MESALKGVTSSCWWQNDLMTVVGPNPGRRKPMCLFMAESTLNSGKVSVGQAIEKKQGCWIVFDSQSFPNSSKVPNLKSVNAGIFITRWWTKKTKNGKLSWSGLRVIRKLSSAGSCCSRRIRWFRSSAIFVHRFTLPKISFGLKQAVMLYCWWKKSKQPPGMVKTL